MKPSDRNVFIVRLADAEAPGVEQEILALSGIPARSPYWRRHAPNLLTVRAEDKGKDLAAKLSQHEGIDRVIALDQSRLSTRWPNGDPEPVCLSNGAVFDGTQPVVIAGPCSVEGPEQVLEIAEVVAKAGAKALRGGVFKPRTSPYDFGGLGADGLQMMIRARRETGLPICTEVLDPACLDVVAEHADLLQIGSRNMHNMPFLFALGADPHGRPALLKRGLAATIEEFLEAAEYFLLGRVAAGHVDPGLILCERGVRTFETSTRFMLDIASIAVLHKRTYLPVIVDPSHPAGDHTLVNSLAAASLAAGADGLLVEVHRDPPRAWCDGPQSLNPAEFNELMATVANLQSGPVNTMDGGPRSTFSSWEGVAGA